MKKHIVVPATAEQIARNLGVTQEDRDIVAKVLREIDEEDRLSSATDSTKDSSTAPRYGFPEKDR
jgi:hypothetical protein